MVLLYTSNEQLEIKSFKENNTIYNSTKETKKGRKAGRHAGRQEVFLAELHHSKHPYVDALTPSSSECDCTWRKGLLKRLLSKNEVLRLGLNPS